MGFDSILIVSSDNVIGDELTAALTGFQLEVDFVCDADTALNYLQVRPDCTLVLSDLEISGTDGIKLLDAVSQEFPGVPVVLFSRRKTAGRVTQAFRNGAFDFLSWPRERKLLGRIVQTALEHGRMRRQSLTYRRNLEELISERTRKLRVAMTSLERSYDITLEAMGDALDLRDAETQGHSQRVTAYTVAIARAMNVPAEDLKVIARGAFLHDIGKIAIPDAILLKPGKLTPEEMVIMREHCQRGYDMVRKIPFLDEASEIVFTHQEAYDGTGYPRGLAGNEIPLGARIFAIADTLDAMTSDRPYRKGLSFEQALTEIERCKGTQFDPAIVTVFLSLPVSTWQHLRDSASRKVQALDLVRIAA